MRHRSGVAVRFPRMLRWRRDKPIAEAETLDALNARLMGQGGTARPEPPLHPKRSIARCEISRYARLIFTPM